MKPLRTEFGKKTSRQVLLTMLMLLITLSQGLGFAEVKPKVKPSPKPAAKSETVVKMPAKVKDEVKTWEKGKVPILLYHHLDPKAGNNNPVVITPDKFESDLKTLKAEGFTSITFTELKACIEGTKTWPDKPVVITFDDGYYSNYRYAYPLLKANGMKASFFVIGWSVGRQSFENSDQEINPHFTWQQAKEMVDSGVVTIENHTFDLHNEAGLSNGNGSPTGKGVAQLDNESSGEYVSRLVNDFEANQALIKDAVGKAATVLAYPMGVHSELSYEAVLKAGMMGSVTTVKGIRVYSHLSDLQDMPRLNVDMCLKGEKLIKAIEGLPLK